mgnify:CR=1 FL=1
MHIFLNPPRTFWAIPETDIILTRSAPFLEITVDELEELNLEQKNIIRLAKEANVITEINPEFIPKGFNKVGADYIVTLPATEIQKRYISRMIMAKDIPNLNALRAAEEKSDRPRQSVLKTIDYAVETVLHDLGEDPRIRIEEVDDDKGGTVLLDFEKGEAEPKPKPKTRRTRKPKVIEES